MSSLRRRLTLGLGLVLCLLWGAGAVALYLTMRVALVAEFDHSLEAQAQALATATGTEEGRIEFDFAPDLMPAFSRAHEPDYFQMWLPDGSAAIRSPSLGTGHLPPLEGTPEAPAFADLTLPDGLHGRAIGFRFMAPADEEADEPAPRLPVTLVVGRHRTDLDGRLHLLATALLLVGGGTALATIALAPLLVRRGLRPLSSLAARTAAIDASALDLRFPTEGLPDELAPICDRLNELLNRLQASFERERRFSADVAHELRTPIAELRSTSETAIRWPEDRAATVRALQDALEIAVQMETITAGLLALARCEAGLQAVAREPVGLAAMLQEVWRPLEGRATEKGLDVSWDVPPGASVKADPSLLRLMLTNLLSNAVEYSPVKGPVRCAWSEMGKGWRVTVSNRAPDLASDDVPHLFERFWRKDAARTGSRSGLGLSLVKAFAESMGLEVGAELRPDGILAVVLGGGRTAPPEREAQPARVPGRTAEGARAPSKKLAFMLALALCGTAAAQERAPTAEDASETVDLMVKAGRPLRVALDSKVRVKRVGQPVTGTIVEPVYVHDRMVVPVGSRVRGHIEQLVKPSKGTRMRSVAVGNLSPPRSVELQFDGLRLGDGVEIPLTTVVGPGMPNAVLQTSEAKGLVGRGREEVTRRAKELASQVHKPGKMSRLKDGLLGLLPFHAQYLHQGTVYDAVLVSPLDFGTAPAVERAPPGTAPPPESILNARIVTSIDSMHTDPGAPVRAVMTQPLFSAEHKLILPEGTELVGEVTFARPARHLRRNGQLRFTFESMQAPEGAPETLRASLESAEVSQHDRLAIDDEGGARVTNPATRFVGPTMAAGVVGLSMVQESVLDPGEVQPGVVPGATESSTLGTTLGGFSGLGWVGVGLTALWRPLGVGFAVVGLVHSVYRSFFDRGKDVSFPAGLRIQVQLAPAPLPEATPSPSPPPGADDR